MRQAVTGIGGVFLLSTDPAALGAWYRDHLDDMDAMIAQLRSDGIEVEGPQDEPYGRFAWIEDPDGNRIELYQEIEPQA